jgi:hypothetical protein
MVLKIAQQEVRTACRRAPAEIIRGAASLLKKI